MGTAITSPHVASIHILDNDSSPLSAIFLGEDEDTFYRLQGGREPWDRRGRWWYQLAHVCQRWRNLILRSASYMHLSLVCTNGTPVENMLAHSPHLPLIIDYIGSDTTAEDEEGILLALEQRHRVSHIRLFFPDRILQKLAMAIEAEFSILEYLIVEPRTRDSSVLVLPETLQTPNLRHLMVFSSACPIRPRLP